MVLAVQNVRVLKELRRPTEISWKYSSTRVDSKRRQVSSARHFGIREVDRPPYSFVHCSSVIH